MRGLTTRWAAAAIAGGSIFLAVPSGPVFAHAEQGTHAPAEDSSAAMVRRGSHGPRVVQVQTALRNLGYHVTADGLFGPRTETAVKQFQSSKGLQADGIVGPKTSAALGLPAATPATTPVSAAPAPTTPTTPVTPPPSNAIYVHPRANVERWHGEALAAGWTEAEWPTLSCIINRESGGIPTAKNRSSGAAGLLQIMWSAHYAWIGGSAEQLLDGPSNLRLGRTLFERSGWNPWKSVTNQC